MLTEFYRRSNNDFNVIVSVLNGDEECKVQHALEMNTVQCVCEDFIQVVCNISNTADATILQNDLWKCAILTPYSFLVDSNIIQISSYGMCD